MSVSSAFFYFLCLFVVINSENLYFASRLGLDVESLGPEVYLLTHLLNQWRNRCHSEICLFFIKPENPYLAYGLEKPLGVLN